MATDLGQHGCSLLLLMSHCFDFFFFSFSVSLTPEGFKVEKSPRKQSNSVLSLLQWENWDLRKLRDLPRYLKTIICSLFFIPMSSLLSYMPTPTLPQSSMGREIMERTCNLVTKDLSSTDVPLSLNFSGPQGVNERGINVHTSQYFWREITYAKAL